MVLGGVRFRTFFGSVVVPWAEYELSRPTGWLEYSTGAAQLNF